MTAERPNESSLSALIVALAGFPVGLFTVTMEYGLATVGCVASTAAELHAVYRSQVSRPAAGEPSADHADVIPLRGEERPRP